MYALILVAIVCAVICMKGAQAQTGGESCSCNPQGDDKRRCPPENCKTSGLILKTYTTNRHGHQGRLLRTEVHKKEINYNWGSGRILQSGRRDNVLLHFKGLIKGPVDGDVEFRTQSDDGVRLDIGRRNMISQWRLQGPTFASSTGYKMKKGRYYPISLKWYEHGGGAVLRLYWRYQGSEWHIVPAFAFFQNTGREPKPKPNSPPARWHRIPGGLRTVSIGKDWTWGTNRGHQIYKCKNPCRGKWQFVLGGLKQIDVGGKDVWGVNRGNQIWRRRADGSGPWQRIRGGLKHVSVGPNDHVWGVNRNNDIFTCSPPGKCRGRWRHIGGKLTQVDVGQHEVWGVNRHDQIFRRNVDGSGHWRRVPGGLKHVSVGDQWVYGVNRANYIYKCKQPCRGRWRRLPGRLNYIDVGDKEVVGVNSGHAIYRRRTGA